VALLDPKTRILLNLFVPQRRKPNPRHAIPDSDKDLSGKTVVFTGGTDGMGRVAAEMLVKMGASVVILGRNQTKGESAVREVSAKGGRGAASFERCDLASMPSIQECASRVLGEHSRIDVLVNCAGVNATTRTVTQEGFETNWAINYLGPFLLTKLLLGRIQDSAPARIVNLTTNTDFLDHIDFDDLQSERGFGKSYTQSKVAMSMFTHELARRLDGKGVTVNVLHPGYIKSNLLRDLEGPQGVMRFAMQVMASPTEVGAERIVRLAVSSAYQGVTGTFFSEDDIQPPHAEARDATRRERLMQISETAVAPWL